jgi:hypothetical protein
LKTVFPASTWTQVFFCRFQIFRVTAFNNFTGLRRILVREAAHGQKEKQGAEII